jgi:hypothetical protein
MCSPVQLIVLRKTGLEDYEAGYAGIWAEGSDLLLDSSYERGDPRYVRRPVDAYLENGRASGERDPKLRPECECRAEGKTGDAFFIEGLSGVL